MAWPSVEEGGWLQLSSPAMRAGSRTPTAVAATPGGDGREPKANHPTEPGATCCRQGRLTRVKRRGDVSKPPPKIRAALAKPTAAAPMSWLVFVVLDEGSGSTYQLLAVCCSLDGVSCYQLRAHPVCRPGTANLPVPTSRDPKAEILETWAHLKLGGVSGQSFPMGLVALSSLPSPKGDQIEPLVVGNNRKGGVWRPISKRMLVT